MRSLFLVLLGKAASQTAKATVVSVAIRGIRKAIELAKRRLQKKK